MQQNCFFSKIWKTAQVVRIQQGKQWKDGTSPSPRTTELSIIYDVHISDIEGFSLTYFAHTASLTVNTLQRCGLPLRYPTSSTEAEKFWDHFSLSQSIRKIYVGGGGCLPVWVAALIELMTHAKRQTESRFIGQLKWRAKETLKEDSDFMFSKLAIYRVYTFTCRHWRVS